MSLERFVKPRQTSVKIAGLLAENCADDQRFAPQRATCFRLIFVCILCTQFIYTYMGGTCSGSHWKDVGPTAT